MVLCLSKLWFILDQPQSLYFSQGSSGQARLCISSLMELARSRAIEQHIDVHLSLIRSKKVTMISWKNPPWKILIIYRCTSEFDCNHRKPFRILLLLPAQLSEDSITFFFSLLLPSILKVFLKRTQVCSLCQTSCEKRSRFYIPRFLDMIQNLSDFQLYLQTIKSQPHHQALDLFGFSSKNENFLEWIIVIGRP